MCYPLKENNPRLLQPDFQDQKTITTTTKFFLFVAVFLSKLPEKYVSLQIVFLKF